MRIERWDPADTDGAAGCHAVYLAAQAVDDPEGPVFSPRLFRGWLAHGWLGDPREAWFSPGTGWYRLVLPEHANTDRAYLELVVSPEARGRGAGAELLDHALARAVDNGRSLVRGWVWEGSPGEAFAVAHGGIHDFTDVRRVQDVAAAPRETLVADGYSLVTWTGVVPEEMIDQLVALHTAMEDAPDSEGAEPRVWDAEQVRTVEKLSESFGLREYHVGARHDATGELAALTRAGVDPADPEWGYQELTVVLRAHRGHRLGLAVKSAMLDLLAPAEPRLRRIVTDNAETNEHMIAVNEALGYRVFGPPMKYYRRSVVKS